MRRRLRLSALQPKVIPFDLTDNEDLTGGSFAEMILEEGRRITVRGRLFVAQTTSSIGVRLMAPNVAQKFIPNVQGYTISERWLGILESSFQYEPCVLDITLFDDIWLGARTLLTTGEFSEGDTIHLSGGISLADYLPVPE